MGRTVLLLDAPLMACNCFNNTDVDTINLMSSFDMFLYAIIQKRIKFLQSKYGFIVVGSFVNTSNFTIDIREYSTFYLSLYRLIICSLRK